MKLIYRQPRTGQRVAKCFARWPDLLDETWRIYFRSLDWSGKLDCICQAGCDALDEVWSPLRASLTSQSVNSQLHGT